MPPKRNADEPSEARIVIELGKEFNIDEVYGSESTIIGSLKSVNDFNPVEVPSNSPLNFDMVMLEDKEPPQGNDDDQPMASGEEDGKVNAKEKSATVKQNEKLYAEEGMLNTKMRKTDEKRRKKKNQPSAMEHDGNDDYDYTKDSAMETGDEVEDDETKKNRFELPSGVELDNE